MSQLGSLEAALRAEAEKLMARAAPKPALQPHAVAQIRAGRRRLIVKLATRDAEPPST